jgi:CTP:molybdopterin cytidylyltransferase MocA
MPNNRVAGIVLAAGGATRFGSDKLAADWAGQTLLQWSATAMLDAGLDPVLAVVQPGVVPPLPARVTAVVNEQWRDGIATSVRAGLAPLGGELTVCAAVIAPADQPWCRTDVYQRLLDSYRSSDHSIVIATYDGAMRNPVLLARRQWTLADQIEGDTGLSAVVRRLKPLEVECGDVGSVIDIDTPADLAHASAAQPRTGDAG